MSLTIYPDTNIYRYLALGELSVITVGEIRFGFSTAHFEDIISNPENEIALEGMKKSKAVEIVSNEDHRYDFDDIGVCLEYTDPIERYNLYKSDMSVEDPFIMDFYEIVMSLLGSPNNKLLDRIPNNIMSLADDLDGLSTEQHKLLTKGLSTVADSLKDSLDKFEPTPLQETRTSVGLKSGASGIVNVNTVNPIERIWKHIDPGNGELTKEQLFGRDRNDNLDEEYERGVTVSVCHLMLNMLGYYPDEGLPNRDKLPTILADGNHIGFGSLCGIFTTADKRAYNKAKAIYEYKGYATQPFKLTYIKDKMELLVVDPAVKGLIPDSTLSESIRNSSSSIFQVMHPPK